MPFGDRFSLLPFYRVVFSRQEIVAMYVQRECLERAIDSCVTKPLAFSGGFLKIQLKLLTNDRSVFGACMPLYQWNFIVSVLIARGLLLIHIPSFSHIRLLQQCWKLCWSSEANAVHNIKLIILSFSLALCSLLQVFHKFFCTSH